MLANMENSAVATGLEKVSFNSNPKERQCQRMLKLPHNLLISHASKVMPKILQARLQQYMNRELPDVQAGFRKGRGPRDQIANICWIMEKVTEFQKNIYFYPLTIVKPLSVRITIYCGKFLEIEIPDHLTCLLKNLYIGQEATVRRGYGTMEWFKIGKGVLHVVYCHSAFLTYMQCTSCEMPA